jgi:hypothetical protein
VNIEQNIVTVFRLSTIQNKNKVMAYQLEVTPLRIKKQQQMETSVAPSLMGMTQVAPRLNMRGMVDTSHTMDLVNSAIDGSPRHSPSQPSKQ